MTARPSATETGLIRAMRLPHATALVVGSIIGASIFVQPSVVMSEVPSATGVLAVWLAAGVLTVLGALICAELASTFSTTGGVYVYLKESISPLVGFLWGWAMLWVMHSGIIAVIALVTAQYFGGLVPLGATPEAAEVATKMVAIGVIVGWSAVNYFGVRHGSRLQTAFTIVKVATIGVIVVLGFTLSPANPVDPAPAPDVAGGVTPAAFLTAVAAGLFAYGGWHMVTYNAEETVAPRRTIPRALMIGTGLVTLCYIGMNAVYLHVLPVETVVHSNKVAADLADALLGANGRVIMSALVVVSCLGAISGIILSGPRVYYAMARDGLAIRWLGAIHPRYRTPHRAIVLQAIWASVLVATGTWREIFRQVIEVEWLFFAAMAIGLYLIRRRNLPRDYSVWGYPVTPAAFALCAAAVALNALIHDQNGFWAAAARGLGPVLIGVPVYYLWLRRRPSRTGDPNESP